MKRSDVIFLFLTVIQNLISAQSLSSSCPEYFRYAKAGSEIYGIVAVPPPTVLWHGQDLRVEVKISVKENLLGVSFHKFSLEVECNLYFITNRTIMAHLNYLVQRVMRYKMSR